MSDFIDTFKTHYDCGENYPNYSQFVYGYATLLAGGDYNFTLQKPEQSVGAPATGLFSTMQNTAFVPGGSYVAPEDASNVPILSDVIAAAPTQAPATSTWGGFGSVVSGAITPDENEAEEEEESFLLDLESDYACYMTLTQDELANLSLCRRSALSRCQRRGRYHSHRAWRDARTPALTGQQATSSADLTAHGRCSTIRSL